VVRLIFLARLLLACSLATSAVAAPVIRQSDDEKLRTREIVSKVHTIDRVYPSMKGPSDTQYFRLADTAEPELVWLKSARVEIVDSLGVAQSSKYLCHSNLYFSDYRLHHKIFGRTVTPNQRFVDINQGLLEVRLPDGFGIPLMSNESLHFHSMVLNLEAKPEPLDLQVKTTFHYLRDSEKTGPIKALAHRSIPMWVRVAASDAHAHHRRAGRQGTTDAAKDDEGPGDSAERECLEGGEVCAPANEHGFRTRADGVRESVHWVVPPGRHEYRFRPPKGLKIPYPETNVHLVTGHMHAYGEFIELRDLTAGETLFRTEAEGFDDAIGIEHMSHYSSPKGVPVHQKHEYEIVAMYNNTTSHPIDAMAVLYLYYLDKRFDERAIRPQQIGDSRARGDAR
jgi:hypothetical protein